MISSLRRSIRIWPSRLSSKLIIAYTLLTVIPMSLLGLVSYWQYEQSMERQLGELMPRFLQQANANIMKQMAEIAEMPDLLFNSETVISILRQDSYQKRSEYNQDQYEVNRYLTRTYLQSNANPDILGVFIFSKNRFFHSSRLEFSGLPENGISLPYGQDLDLRQAKLILPGEIDLAFANQEPYFVILNQIHDVDNRKNLGTMLVAVSLTFFDRIFQTFMDHEDSVFWVMKRTGEIVYHTDRSQIGRLDRELPHYPVANGSFRMGRGNDGRIISLSDAGQFDLILAHSIPLRTLTKSTDLMRTVTMILFALIAILTSVMSILIVLKITRPLNRLSRAMREVERGRFQVDVPVHTRDEVGRLARSFQSMMATIRDLIERNYEIRIRQKEAELYALQQQINPHFMYNTLETINMAVEEGKTGIVVDMVTVLGRMLRYSVGKRTPWVTIAEEVRHVQDYLTIQQIRFKDRLSFEIQDKIDMDQLWTPKFILQPVVENAVKYGLESRKQLSVQIVISREFGARSGKEDVVFRVRDNGPGIPPERLEQLEASLRSDLLPAKDSGFGLVNVNARIAMMLGQDYGVQVHSIVDKGTEVTLRIPVIGPEEAVASMKIKEVGGHESHSDPDRGR